MKRAFKRRLFPVDLAADEKTSILQCQIRDAMDAFGWVVVYHFSTGKFMTVQPREAFELCRSGVASLEDIPQQGNSGEEDEDIREPNRYRTLCYDHLCDIKPGECAGADTGGDV